MDNDTKATLQYEENIHTTTILSWCGTIILTTFIICTTIYCSIPPQLDPTAIATQRVAKQTELAIEREVHQTRRACIAGGGSVVWEPTEIRGEGNMECIMPGLRRGREE